LNLNDDENWPHYSDHQQSKRPEKVMVDFNMQRNKGNTYFDSFVFVNWDNIIGRVSI
jgi:hypothetical protein